jgi:hypothetical protein
MDSRSVWRDFGGFGEKLPNGSMAPSPDLIADMLAAGTPSSRRIADAIRRGDLNVSYGELPWRVVGRYYGGTGTFVLNNSRPWMGSNGLLRAASTAAHEGQHFLDDIAGIASKGSMTKNVGYFEARAHLRQQQFLDSIGASHLGPLGADQAERAARWARIKKAYGIQ